MKTLSSSFYARDNYTYSVSYRKNASYSTHGREACPRHRSKKPSVSTPSRSFARAMASCHETTLTSRIRSCTKRSPLSVYNSSSIPSHSSMIRSLENITNNPKPLFESGRNGTRTPIARRLLQRMRVRDVPKRILPQLRPPLRRINRLAPLPTSLHRHRKALLDKLNMS